MNIVEPVKEFFRRRALKKYKYHGESGSLSKSKIHSAAVLVDVTTPEFDELRNDLVLYFRNQNIKMDIYYMDFRKIESAELLLTSIHTTVLKKDLNWFGMPNLSKLSFITGNKVDMFVSMVPAEDFTSRFICACSPARFKIGMAMYDGDPFNMVFSGSHSPVRCFNEFKGWMDKFA